MGSLDVGSLDTGYMRDLEPLHMSLEEYTSIKKLCSFFLHFNLYNAEDILWLFMLLSYPNEMGTN